MNFSLFFDKLKAFYQKTPSPVKEFIKLKINNPFYVLICTILSSRTKDTTTIEVCKKLKKEIKDCNDLINIDIVKLEDLLYPVGFYKTKAKNLKKMAVLLKDKFNCKIPDTEKELLLLPGVGIKIANIVLIEVYNKPVISVDTHVHRISNRLGIVNTNNVNDTKKQLEEKIPVEYKLNYNRYLVALGQTICKSRKPECNLCPVKEFCKRGKENG